MTYLCNETTYLIDFTLLTENYHKHQLSINNMKLKYKKSIVPITFKELTKP